MAGVEGALCGVLDPLVGPVFFVESDALAALEGAFAGNPGSILIAGTGSIITAAI